MDASQAWQATLGQLQMELPKATYDTWVRDTKFIKHQDETFTIGVQNAYARDWLENRLTSTATRLLTGIMDAPQQIRFVLHTHEEPIVVQVEEVPVDSTPTPAAEPQGNFNCRYSFNNFVVGPNNRLAHAASQAVAENPANAYNPLFLYGGVGLGKTHLLHAIGNEITRRGQSVLYVSSEEFTNDLINAIRKHDTASFRDRYRKIDVLLIDDIHFIAGKESTQEEFFHTFNTLHGQNKQIVISSDRPPKAMVTLEERLRSRFEWGLIVDIQPPELETRLAILRSKAEKSGREVHNDILEYIARQIQTNIRELEGALTRVLAYSDLSGRPLDIDLAKIALVDFLPDVGTPDPAQILDTVAKAYNLSHEELLSRNRSKSIALPRQVAMYLLREIGNESLPQIGEALGGRDHTTVMYACEKVADLIERDDHFRRQVFQIRDQLYSHQVYA
ncbi:MAG: chromosomal replication initiator protein [Chloroflexota bacterium]|nr:chromosomal replication initiator protein [Chloroflexota bacterium]